MAAFMSSLDSGMKSAPTLIVEDFVEPIWNVDEDKQVWIAHLVTGVVMVLGAIEASSIAGFEILSGDFQTSLSHFIPTIAVYILDLFVPWTDGNGAFLKILPGLVVGIPLFILQEATGLWADGACPRSTTRSCPRS